MNIDRISSGDIVFDILRYGILFVFLGMVILPFVYALSVSFRLPAEFFTQDIYWIPRNPSLKPWITAISELRTPLWNSTLIAVGTMILSLIITIPGAYVFGRKEFPGKRPMFYMIIIVLLFPYILLVIPITTLWTSIGLYNTIPGLWLAYQVFVTPFAIWILTDFFSKLPENLEEAAQVYGCTQFTAFLRVIVPLSAPAIVAVGFLAFLTGWNDFLFSNMLTTGTGPRPAVVTLYLTTAGGERNYWALVMAETLLIGAPPTVLYMVSRRYLSNAFAVN